jgi:hypothetical protein
MIIKNILLSLYIFKKFVLLIKPSTIKIVNLTINKCKVKNHENISETDFVRCYPLFS